MHSYRELKYFPRTSADFEQIAFWVAEGFSTEKIFELMKNEFWRSEIIEEGGLAFCARCDQLILVDFCVECEQPIDSTCPSRTDFSPRVNSIGDWELLDAVAEVLLRLKVNSRKVLWAIQKINRRLIRPTFTDEQVQQLFNDAGTREFHLRGAR